MGVASENFRRALTRSPTTSVSFLPPLIYVSNLRTHMQTIRPFPPRPTQRNSNITDRLTTATHVFINMMLSTNHFNHHMMDHIQSSNESISTSLSTSMVVQILFPSTVSNLLTSIETKCNTLHKLQSHPPHRVEQPALVDVYTFCSTFLHRSVS